VNDIAPSSRRSEYFALTASEREVTLGRLRMRHHEGLSAAVFFGVAALLANLPACTTKDLVGRFNSGILDSAGDPNHDPARRSRSLVRQLITHELMDGYFSQGSATGAVVRWMERAANEPHSFVYAVAVHARSLGNTLGVGPGALGTPSRAPRSDAPGGVFHDVGASWRRASSAVEGAPATAPLCQGGQLQRAAAGERADANRFDAAVERAGEAVAAIAIEGLANVLDIQVGAQQAFEEMGRYLIARKRQRSFDHHPSGVVIKGGASTGLYSAGVVWVALHLIDHCLADDACRASAVDPRFSLLSGTSTGAMIAVATDIYNSAATPEARARALDNLASWFTCVGVANLYCVRSNDALEMLRGQKGLVEFDGIQNLLVKNVTCDTIRNSSELVLNTVDFRTGNVYDLSDDDELRTPNDVVQAAIASAVLPFIAKPVPHLPVDYDGANIEQAYLDGGIRSELPVLPLARRGAERVLIVSSSASIADEQKDLSNGMAIATRYIDISTGGVTESELQHAERHVESVRLAEIDACQTDPTTREACAKDDRCIREFCEADWTAVCDARGARDRKLESLSAFDLTQQRLAFLWGTRSFFRNETEVEGLHGYDFDPIKQRRLFLAGAEAARLRCAEIATLLGIPMGPQLSAWCAPVLVPHDTLCRAFASASSSDLRACQAAPTPGSTEACR